MGFRVQGLLLDEFAGEDAQLVVEQPVGDVDDVWFDKDTEDILETEVHHVDEFLTHHADLHRVFWANVWEDDSEDEEFVFLVEEEAGPLKEDTGDLLLWPLEDASPQDDEDNDELIADISAPHAVPHVFVLANPYAIPCVAPPSPPLADLYAFPSAAPPSPLLSSPSTSGFPTRRRGRDDSDEEQPAAKRPRRSADLN